MNLNERNKEDDKKNKDEAEEQKRKKKKKRKSILPEGKKELKQVHNRTILMQMKRK